MFRLNAAERRTQLNAAPLNAAERNPVFRLNAAERRILNAGERKVVFRLNAAER